MNHNDTRPQRRLILQGIGAALVIAPLSRLITACNESESAANDAGSDAASAAAVRDAASDAGHDVTQVAWAGGGTASMTAKDKYPNPFADAVLSSCVATCQLTQGPCWDSQAETRQDISYGQAGLPLRMMLQLVDDACKPVADAVVDVWHVAPSGKYSGDDSANEQVGFCTGNDTEYTSHRYFRGKQTSNAQGIVYFDTCFPGWYASRTIHIHMTISVGGTAYLTTQLVFEDTLDDEIVTGQPLYDTRGARDTTNATDTVVSGATYKDYVFETAKMSDGAMLAWKTLCLRSSTDTALCGDTGGMMGGGPGGMPPAGGMPPGGGIPPAGGMPPGAAMRDAG